MGLLYNMGMLAVVTGLTILGLHWINLENLYVQLLYVKNRCRSVVVSCQTLY